MSNLVIKKDPWFASVMIDKRELHEGTGTIIITISTELTNADSKFLKDVFARELEAGYRNLILDCKHVDMLFSVHVGIIWSNCQKFRKIKGDVRFLNMKEGVQAVLERLGLLKVIKVFDDIDDAIASFN